MRIQAGSSRFVLGWRVAVNQEKRIVAGYIEQVDRARSQTDALSESDLHSIAGELGLTAEDLERVDQIAADHLTRGEGYLEHDLLDEAISELTLARGLRPLSAPPALSLARAYTARWRKEARTSDRDKATELARQSLKLSPESPGAYALLRRLKAPQERSSRIAAAIAAVVLAALLVGGAVVGLSLLDQPQAPEVATPAPLTNLAPASGSLPVTVVPYSILPGLTIESPVSDLQEYGEATSFKLGSVLVNGTDQVLKEATVELSLLAEDGTVVYRRSIDMLKSHHARVRPGDRHAFSNLTHLTPLPAGYQTPHRIELRFVEVEAMPAAASYSDAEVRTLHWESEQPSGIEVSLHRRSSQASSRSSGDFFHREEYAFQSTPESGSIERLKLRIDYLDADGEVIGSDESYAVTSSEPAMLPGEVRLISFLETVSAKPADTQVTVIDVR
ncbi:MAG: hypothetical protein ACI8RZ_004016 [Myxococcota bacterium]|jgi:hypothetical protein